MGEIVLALIASLLALFFLICLMAIAEDAEARGRSVNSINESVNKENKTK